MKKIRIDPSNRSVREKAVSRGGVSVKIFRSTKRAVPIFFCVFVISALAARCRADDGFRAWIDNFYQTAKEQGISEKVWEDTFAGVDSVDEKVLKKANFQPEFSTEIWDYIELRVNELAIRKGERMARYYARTLSSVEERFGVEKSVLLAIWSMESNYGAIFEKPERLHYVPRALATLAYKDPKRSRFARTQLIAAVQILQAGDIDKEKMTGSWAGAMGHTQFIPTSYLAYGVDMDNNGRRDIWNSVPDALATAANLLSKNGWQTGKTWGYEVTMPENAKSYREKTKPLSEWQKLGFVRANGHQFPRPEDKAEFVMLAGPDGPGFLMLKNFFVLKRYNNSNAYALAVGLLADRLVGSKGLVQSWPRLQEVLSIKEKMELQGLLQKKGCYTGDVDGYVGPETQNGIEACQRLLGVEDNGMASRELLLLLRE
jgi:membrane-bound lytic murein transglycosylase B